MSCGNMKQYQPYVWSSVRWCILEKWSRIFYRRFKRWHGHSINRRSVDFPNGMSTKVTLHGAIPCQKED